MSRKTDDLLKQRERTHGDFAETAALAQMFKDVARRSNNWAALPFFLREAIDGLLFKLARLLCGDFAFPDHLDDMIGYLALARKILAKERKRKKP
jgi:hypothetical protein